MNIKGMNKDMLCRGFQFEVGKEYKIETDKPLKLCSDNVFHYCKSLRQVHNYYSCEDENFNRFFEIEVLGEEITDGEKCGSNHIKIIREIVGDELKQLKGYFCGNTGLFNSGDWNSGDMNSGNRNSGNWNSGNRNSGNRNSGYMNSGDWNSGNRNSGNRNSGDWNSGDWNSGDWNSCNGSDGVFCNKNNDNIRIFNKPSGMSLEQFRNSEFYQALNSVPFCLNEWVNYSEEEMKNEPQKEKIGGYLKILSYKEACEKWWKRISNENKKIIMNMPNFDKDVFKNITGIDVREEYEPE